MSAVMPGMSPHVSDTPINTQVMQQKQVTSDKEVWQHILNMKSRGIHFHMESMAACKKHNLKGFAKMHKYHAIQELRAYLHIVGDCIEYLDCVPSMDFTHIHHSEIELKGKTIDDHMICSLEQYEDWEDETYNKLKEFKHQLTETKEHIDYLIRDVRAERQFIHEIWEEMEKRDYAEDALKKLDDTLYSYFKKKMD